MKLLPYLLFGTAFGFVLTRAEAVSWFRIQEMFRFQSFHMYGLIGSAVLVGMASMALIRRLGLRSFGGEEIVVPTRTFQWGQVIGGTTFGLGWAMTGACPGPLLALVGGGIYPMTLALVSAVLGTWVYGRIRHRLPH